MHCLCLVFNTARLTGGGGGGGGDGGGGGEAAATGEVSGETSGELSGDTSGDGDALLRPASAHGSISQSPTALIACPQTHWSLIAHCFNLNAGLRLHIALI